MMNDLRRTGRQQHAPKLPSLAMASDGQLTEGGDPLLKWRVSTEQACENGTGSTSKERLDDTERRSGLGNVARNALVVGAQLLQGADQAVRIADHAGAGFVGGVLALPGDAELQKHGGAGSQEKHQERGEAAAFTVVIAPAPAKPEAKASEIGNGAGYGGSDGTDENVVIGE